MKMLGHGGAAGGVHRKPVHRREDSNDRDTKDKIRAAQKTEG